LPNKRKSKPPDFFPKLVEARDQINALETDLHRVKEELTQSKTELDKEILRSKADLRIKFFEQKKTPNAPRELSLLH